MKINYERPEVLEIALEAQNVLCGSNYPAASATSIEEWEEEVTIKW